MKKFLATLSVLTLSLALAGGGAGDAAVEVQPLQSPLAGLRLDTQKISRELQLISKYANEVDTSKVTVSDRQLCQQKTAGKNWGTSFGTGVDLPASFPTVNQACVILAAVRPDFARTFTFDELHAVFFNEFNGCYKPFKGDSLGLLEKAVVGSPLRLNQPLMRGEAQQVMFRVNLVLLSGECQSDNNIDIQAYFASFVATQENQLNDLKVWFTQQISAAITAGNEKVRRDLEARRQAFEDSVDQRIKELEARSAQGDSEAAERLSQTRAIAGRIADFLSVNCALNMAQSTETKLVFVRLNGSVCRVYDLPKSVAGTQGPVGPQGPAGTPGKDGVSTTITVIQQQILVFRVETLCVTSPEVCDCVGLKRPEYIDLGAGWRLWYNPQVLPGNGIARMAITKDGDEKSPPLVYLQDAAAVFVNPWTSTERNIEYKVGPKKGLQKQFVAKDGVWVPQG